MGVVPVALAFIGATQGPEGTALVRGRVVDAISGRPIRAARITFSTPYEPNGVRLPGRYATTDATGVFEVGELIPGDYLVETAARGDYLNAPYGARAAGAAGRRLRVGDGARLDITIQAWPAASVSGRVLDARGRPVVQVNVNLLRRDGTTGMGESTETDDRGEYMLSGLQAGEYSVGVPVTLESRTINATPPLSTSSSEPMWVPPFLLDRGERTVLMTHGGAMPPASTDGSTRLPVTTYYGGGDYAGAKFFTVAPGQARSGIDIVLNERVGRRISGEALGPDGPVAGIVLTLRPPGQSHTYLAGNISATAASDGSFVFVAVPEGTYELTAYRRNPPHTEITFANGAPSNPHDDYSGPDPDSLWTSMPLTVSGEDVANLSIVLRRGTLVSGRFVREDGEPLNTRLPSIRVALKRFGTYLFGDSTGYAAVQMRPDGSFIARARPGEYLIEPRSQIWSFRTARLSGRELERPLLTIGDAPVSDLELVYARGDTIVRVAIADARGAPLGEAAVLVFPTDERIWNSDETAFPFVRLERRTSPSYAITGLAPGDYYVVAVDETFQRLTLSRKNLEALAPVATRVQLRLDDTANVNLVAREGIR